jgi:hypothetical protein
MDDDLKESLELLRDALEEHERTWGNEAHAGEDDWSSRSAVLLAKYERKQ